MPRNANSYFDWQTETEFRYAPQENITALEASWCAFVLSVWKSFGMEAALAAVPEDLRPKVIRQFTIIEKEKP